MSATVSQSGTQVTVTFNEAIRSSPAPDSGLRVEVDDEYAALRRGAYAVSGRTVTARLSRAVTLGQSVTVEVERGGTIHDFAGNRASPRAPITALNTVPAVTLVLTPDSVLENGGTSVVTAKLNTESSEDTTVTVTVTPQHPAVAGDITVSTNRTLRIAAGATSSAGTVTITAVDNSTAAAAKAFTVSATVSGEDGFSHPPVSRTLGIDDDDSGGICARTRQVREAILAEIEGVTQCAGVTNTHLGRITGTLDLEAKGITSLRTGDFAGLSSVTLLNLSFNALRTLPPRLLKGMSKLNDLYLDDNALTALPSDLLTRAPSLYVIYVRNNALTELPERFLAGKDQFAEIQIYNNPGDPDLEHLDPLSYNRGSPLGVHVSLQPLGDGQFKIVVPVGSPCDMVVTLDVTNGTIDSETVTIPPGRLESGILSVTRTKDTTGAVTVDITDLRATTPDPRYPNNDLMVMPIFHNGYVMVKAGPLPATVIAGEGQQVSITAKDGADSVTEGTAVAFTLTRQAPHDEALTVTVDVEQTGNVIKTADSYEAPSDVSFEAGEETATLTVETQADADEEDAGSITVTVTAGSDAPYAVGVPSAATVTVTRRAQVSIAAKDGADSVTEGAAAAFTLTRQEPHDEALTVTVDVTQTGNVIKTADSYEAPSDVSFEAGEGTATLTVETQTDADEEGAGSITATVTAGADESYTVGTPSTATVSVTREEDTEVPEVAGTQVPGDWSLIPTGLSAGDRFRLLIVTSTTRHARVNAVRFYDAHVHRAVAAGHTDIRAHSAAFRMLGCTKSVDARTHTETAGDGGAPIYWLGGAQVADDYADLYDGSWSSNALRDESGALSSHTKVFTGCASDGTTDDALGKRWVDIGKPGTSGGEIESGSRTLRTMRRPLYGLSPVFEVAQAEPPPPPLTASLVNLPERHDGTTAFSFELRFSEDVPVLSYKTLRDAAFTVTDGRVTDVRRLAPQATVRNRRWEVTVEPDSSRDVVVTLPATTDCAAAGAVCLGDGRMLSGMASATVPGPAPALTASLVDLPERHDGATAFSFELRFSEDVPVLSYKTLRDAAFMVTEGEVTYVRRLAPQATDRNRRWEITVEPDSFRDVAVTLPATTDCEAAGAVCLGDGRMLSGTASATVPGPALSVADAEAEEGTDDTLDFSVTLVPARTVTVTVDYATSDDTAKAGSDYTATSGTLTFAAGDTEKTVSVPVLVDDVDEGSETVTLTLSNAQGATIADGEAMGTIANNGPIPKAWLARFGRTVTGQVLDAVEARLAAPRTPGAEMSLAGQGLPSWTAGGSAAATDDGEAAAAAAEREDAQARRALASMTAWLAQTGPDGRGASGSGTGFGPAFDGTGREPESRALTQRDFITGTSFALTGGSSEGGGFASLWGRGSIAGFDGREGALTVDGEVTTGLVGADWASANWTAGLALGHSTGTGGWRRGGGCDLNCGGAIEATLSGLYPYAGIDLTERLTLWAAAGWGAGEVTVTPEGEAGLTADLSMAMGAAGVQSEVLRPEGGEGLALAVKGDARFTRTSSDAVRSNTGNLAAADGDVWGLRTGIEGSRPVALGEDGASLTPSFELGLRLDGGDAETGFGADLGGGLAFSDPKSGVALDAKARGLVAHESPGFREWGASLAASWDPRPTTDRGLSLTLRQSWGASPAGGIDALLGRETLADLAANDEDGGAGFEASSRLEGELGYGVPAFGGAFTGTPNVGFGLSDGGARDWRIGWRLTSVVPGDPGFDVNLDATRSEPADDDATPEHAVTLRAAIRW